MPEGPPYDQSAAAPSFDPKKAIAELVNSMADSGGRKLQFDEQCAAFYAAYNHKPHKIIADAFGVTVTTISLLAGCLKRDPNPIALELKLDPQTGALYEHEHNRDMNKNRDPGRIWRYRRVAEEFERLGEHEFARRYYTDAIHERLMRVKYNIDGEATARHRLAPNPIADKKAFRTIGAFPINDEFWRVDWLTWQKQPQWNGWYFAYCKADGSVIDSETKFRWYGAEEAEQERKPYRTSGYAYNAAFAFCHMPVPRG